jgi:hypothetical protein
MKLSVIAVLHSAKKKHAEYLICSRSTIVKTLHPHFHYYCTVR